MSKPYNRQKDYVNSWGLRGPTTIVVHGHTWVFPVQWIVKTQGQAGKTTLRSRLCNFMGTAYVYATLLHGSAYVYAYVDANFKKIYQLIYTVSYYYMGFANRIYNTRHMQRETFPSLTVTRRFDSGNWFRCLRCQKISCRRRGTTDFVGWINTLHISSHLSTINVFAFKEFPIIHGKKWFLQTIRSHLQLMCW